MYYNQIKSLKLVYNELPRGYKNRFLDRLLELYLKVDNIDYYLKSIESDLKRDNISKAKFITENIFNALCNEHLLRSVIRDLNIKGYRVSRLKKYCKQIDSDSGKSEIDKIDKIDNICYIDIELNRLNILINGINIKLDSRFCLSKRSTNFFNNRDKMYYKFSDINCDMSFDDYIQFIDIYNFKDYGKYIDIIIDYVIKELERYYNMKPLEFVIHIPYNIDKLFASEKHVIRNRNFYEDKIYNFKDEKVVKMYPDFNEIYIFDKDGNIGEVIVDSDNKLVDIYKRASLPILSFHYFLDRALDIEKFREDITRLL